MGWRRERQPAEGAAGAVRAVRPGGREQLVNGVEHEYQRPLRLLGRARRLILLSAAEVGCVAPSGTAETPQKAALLGAQALPEPLERSGSRLDAGVPTPSPLYTSRSAVARLR